VVIGAAQRASCFGGAYEFLFNTSHQLRGRSRAGSPPATSPPAIRGGSPSSHKEFGEMAAVCMMDVGDNSVLILADHMLPPRKGGVMIPGPEVHAMKLAFGKYYLWKSRHGCVRLP
jgi:hypothetical protein